MSDKETPLNKQYSRIKEKYPDTVLFYRLGDFFETFNEDAVITSKVCGITLTKRNNGAAGDMPLAGFPHHQLDNYLPKLVRAGYRVAVCEQLEDPKKAKGIVKRDVVEVVTPGVALYDKLLETGANNYVLAVFLGYGKGNDRMTGIAFTDISTGEFVAGEFPLGQLQEVLESLSPAEIIISKTQKNELLELLQKFPHKPPITKLEPWIFDVEFGREALLGHFKTQSLKGYGVENFTLAIASAGAILNYVKETQKGSLNQINKIGIFDPGDFMILDYSTRRNLEITYSIYDSGREGTLISTLDKTCTPMGSRLFKKWITRPLRNLNTINKRLESVRFLFDIDNLRNELRIVLSEIGDLERLISKVCSQRANPRDLVSLKNGLSKISSIKEIFEETELNSLKTLTNSLNPLNELVTLLSAMLIDEPSTQLGTGKVFKPGVSSELDQYIEAKFNGNKWIVKYQEEQREQTGANTLKVGFTSVFGYYIEISKGFKGTVPDTYHRRQTLANAERYITPELKEFETKIFSAEEKITEIENALFTELLMKISMMTEAIQDNAQKIASLDCLQSFAQTSKEFNYCQPVLDDSSVLEIVDGRHPVVERLLSVGEKFTSNSTKLDPSDEMIHIITGPNMSGKSCYLRQAALIVLLGQIGCFVPAKSALIGMVDRIFTRVGAQDNITAGESTFLVEMQEAANILNNATSKSLILLDEVGRGTATFDGISIAWAIAEYIHNEIGAKTLFATHYHELNDLADRYDNIANYKVEVIETGGTVIFSHKVMQGASDHSFGIHVAQMAGLPAEIIRRSNEIMKTLEASGTSSESVSEINTPTPDVKLIKSSKKRVPEQLAIFELRDDSLRDKLRSFEINAITPIQAMQLLSELILESKK